MNARHAAVLSLLALLASSAAAQLPSQTHGEMVGTVDHRSAWIWTRASGAGLVSVRYATNAALLGALETPPVLATSAGDFTAKIPLTGLQSATRYWYAVVLADASGQGIRRQGFTSTFTTAPDPSTRADVVLGFSGDCRDAASYGIFDALRAESLDFYLSLGDFPYADAAPAASTIAEYRAKHRDARSEPRWQAFTRAQAIFATWDDHEVENNWDANAPASKVANGIAVWKEYFPVPPGTGEIYGSFRWGAALEVFLLDCRAHRSANGDPDRAGAKTMLGTTQLAWLRAALAASRADFKLIVSSVPLRYTSGLDHWNGFQQERNALLELLATERIPGVVFVSADQHRPATNHHREGVREYVSGPLAIGVGGIPLRVDPEMRWSRGVRSYSVVRVDASATPARLLLEHKDASGAVLYQESFLSEVPASLEVQADEPELRYTIEGPTTLRGAGRSTTFARVEPGRHVLRCEPTAALLARPAEIELALAPGQRAVLAASASDRPSAAHPVLFAQNFEGPLSGFSILDQGRTSGPSAWFTSGGYLYQSSNINTGSSDPLLPGTLAVAGDPAWRDLTLAVRARSEDNDAFGLVVRYRGPGDYYRFHWDAERSVRRITRVLGGVATVLAQDSVPYDALRWYRLELVAQGTLLRALVDGREVLRATDAAHAQGRIGCTTWANSLTAFDDLIVRAGDATGAPPGPLLEERFEGAFSVPWVFVDDGTVEAPSAWSLSRGELVQASNIADGDGSRAGLPKRGTMAVAGDLAWRDYELRASVLDQDDDAAGLVFRYRDSQNFYRFSLDAQRGYRRLVRCQGGAFTLLAEDTYGHTPNRVQRIAIRAEGARLRVLVDGELFCEVLDPSGIASGRIGCYSWASVNARFDDLLVLPLVPERAVLAALRAPSGWQLEGRAPASAGALSILALSLSRAPGIPLALLDPSDPRTLALAPDALFFLSLGSSTLFVGVPGVLDGAGRFAAELRLPALPALRGVPFYLGGWTSGAGAFSVGELWPTVELRFE